MSNGLVLLVSSSISGLGLSEAQWPTPSSCASIGTCREPPQPVPIQYHARALVSTFAREQCTYGRTSIAAEAWSFRPLGAGMCAPGTPTLTDSDKYYDMTKCINSRSTSYPPSSSIQHAILCRPPRMEFSMQSASQRDIFT
jgi:hypothetical protein